MTASREPLELSVPIAVESLLEILTVRGRLVYVGEDVTQLEHALQCADSALDAGEERDLVASALLHDIGHLFAIDATTPHESAAMALLRGTFSERVLAPIRLHVSAKRYLCAIDSNYWSRLSPHSKYSLELQGGPFSAAEVDGFFRRPYALQALTLRRFDDASKRPGRITRPLDFYRPLLETCAIRPVVTTPLARLSAAN